MKKKKYKLSILPLFEDDLNEIIDYICDVLENPVAANRLLDDIEYAIMMRLEMPESFAIYPSNKARHYPYYRIYVRNFVVFYVVIDDIMEVRRILYSKRDLDSIL